MAWVWALLAIAASFAVALAFRTALRWGRLQRGAAWLIASVIVGLTPCIVPLTAPPSRLAAAMVAVALLVKLYDLSVQSSRAQQMTFPAYVLYLANWFWLVLRQPPPRVPAAHDLKQLAGTAPKALIGVVFCAGMFSLDWSSVPFSIEHSLKVAVLIIAIVLSANSAACVWRLCGGAALDPMTDPIAARTPAEFWQRWNRPAQQFFHEYVYRSIAGGRQPMRTILATFVISGLVHEYVLGVAAGQIQGWQLLFFSLQGIATVGTIRLRPRGWLVLPFVATTIAFNLALAVLFFKSVDAIYPFYSPRIE